MNINLIRIRSGLYDKNKELIQNNTNYIEDINNDLINEDIIIKENCDDSMFDMVFVESGGSEIFFKKIAKKLKEPIVLLSNGKNNSFPAALEIKTYCAINHILCFFLTGESFQVSETLKHISSIVHCANSIQNTNLGVIGDPSDWLISYKRNNKKVYEKFLINLVDIKMEEFFDEIDKKELVENIPHFDQLLEKYKDHDTLYGALYIYSALKRLIAKYDLKGLTVRCFDLLDRYKNTSCLALALLNEEGIVSACEGDIPALITMYLIYNLTSLPTFQANPSTLNFDESSLILAHCTLPLNMVSKYELTTHFESGLGIGIKGELPQGKITICKISPELNLKRDTCFSGTIIENCSLSGYCRTQIKVKLDEEGMFSLLKDNFGNHLIISYSDVRDDFYPLLNLLNIRSSKLKKQKKKD